MGLDTVERVEAEGHRFPAVAQRMAESALESDERPLKRQRQGRGEDDAKTHHRDGYGIIGGELEHDEPPRPNLFLVPSPDPLQHRIQRNNGGRMVTRRLEWKNAAAGLAAALAGEAGPVAVGSAVASSWDALLIIAHVSRTRRAIH